MDAVTPDVMPDPGLYDRDVLATWKLGDDAIRFLVQATSTLSARAPLNSRTPRDKKSSSSAAATSGSFCGSTCWRLTMNVTSQPKAENMCTNSTPVTPDPITTRCSGISRGG